LQFQNVRIENVIFKNPVKRLIKSQFDIQNCSLTFKITLF
jgi:hypothetical protein